MRVSLHSSSRPTRHCQLRTAALLKELLHGVRGCKFELRCYTRRHHPSLCVLHAVDNLYLARDVLESHLWGWSSVRVPVVSMLFHRSPNLAAQTVAAPVLAAHWANVSAHWDLPPMDNLLVYGTPAWKRPQVRKLPSDGRDEAGELAA